MPPLDAKKAQFAVTAQRWQDWKKGLGKLWKWIVVDVRKAHQISKCDDPEAYIERLEEDAEEGMCGKLENWIFCMQGAAHGWEKEFRSKFVEA